MPTVRFEILFVFLILAHDRQRVLHFNLTANPSAEWAAQQIVEALPWDNVPRYLLRDRDRINGTRLRRRMHGMGIEEVVMARRSPWHNPYVERLIGSIRRECLNHVVVLDERHLKKNLKSFFSHYHGWRTRQSLKMDALDHRPVQRRDAGNVVEFPHLGSLHHHNERQAA